MPIKSINISFRFGITVSRLYFLPALVIFSWFVVINSSPKADAASCTVTIDNLIFNSFSNVKPSDVTGKVTAKCIRGSIFEPYNFLVCVNIGAGSAGTDRVRQMKFGDYSINYELYTESQKIWGSRSRAQNFPPPIKIEIPVFGSEVTKSLDIRASIPESVANSMVQPGTYTTLFSGFHVEALYFMSGFLSSLPNDCSGASNLRSAPQPSFTVSVVKSAYCSVENATLNFGIVGLLNQNKDQHTNLNVSCSVGTPYKIKLGNGENGTSSTTRRMKSGANFVSYGLFTNAGRTTPWGSSDTQAVSGIGTGTPKPTPVYGRVPVQATPPAGTYQDKVVVTVEF